MVVYYNTKPNVEAETLRRAKSLMGALVSCDDRMAKELWGTAGAIDVS